MVSLSPMSWLRQTRGLIQSRLSRRHLATFLLIHMAFLLILSLLTFTAIEINRSTSHLLRHIIDEAGVSPMVFRSSDGKVENWRYSPATIIMGDDDATLGGEWERRQGMICGDTGKWCVAVPGRSQQPVGLEQDVEYEGGRGGNMRATTTSEDSPSRSKATFPLGTLANATTGVGAAGSDDRLDNMQDEGEDDGDSDSDGEGEGDSDDGSDSDDDDDNDNDEVEQNQNRIRRLARLARRKRDIALTPVQDAGLPTGVTLTGIQSQPIFVSRDCAMGLSWSINSLDNLVREEIVLACFFIWILILAFVAVLNESIPHLVALLISLGLSSIWLSVEIYLSTAFWASFQTKIVFGRCGGVNVLPNYLKTRLGLQAAGLLLIVLLLGISAWRCWHLRDHFGWQTFKRIGASSRMNRVYNLILALSIVLQLDVFVLIAFFAIWLDQVSTGLTRNYIAICAVWQALTVIVIVLVLPWVITGWRSIRNERRSEFNIFIFLSVLLLTGWTASFTNSLFRLEFVTWTFFGSVGTLAAILTVISIALAIWRRTSFDQGLTDDLSLDNHSTSDDKERVFEIVTKPRTVLPTFSSAFVSGPAKPPRALFPASHNRII